MHDYDNGFYITRNGIINLTEIENELLNILINNKHKVVTINYIYNKLYNKEKENMGNSIRISISRLNHKLKGKIKILNKKSIGYYIIYEGE